MAQLRSLQLVIGIAIISAVVPQCSCDGIISATLVAYEPKNLWQGSNAVCSDNEPCEVFFSFSFTEESNGRVQEWPQITTKAVKIRQYDSNVKFDTRKSNLIQRNLTSFQVNLNLTVLTMRYGTEVPYESFRIHFSPSEVISKKKIDHSFYSSNHPYSIITLALLFRCHKFHFGQTCSQFCRPQNSTEFGHYRCSEWGEKICLQNWQDESTDCVTPLRPCDENRPCLNGGTCKTIDDRRTLCSCTDGWAGPTCNKDRDECLDLKLHCSNRGRCRNLPHGRGFECDCTGTGYQGQKCTEDVDECRERIPVCKNNGACKNKHGGFQCLCNTPFYGKDCSYCNATLIDNGSCPVEPGLTIFVVAIIIGSSSLVVLTCAIVTNFIVVKKCRKKKVFPVKHIVEFIRGEGSNIDKSDCNGHL